jgi:gas vesicle protein
MEFLSGLIIGILTGGTLGIIITALLTASKIEGGRN